MIHESDGCVYAQVRGGGIDTASVLSICTVGAGVDRQVQPCTRNGRFLVALRYRRYLACSMPDTAESVGSWKDTDPALAER
jgi:hypothetical protein